MHHEHCCCFPFEFQTNFQILFHACHVTMFSKHFTNRKQVFGFIKFEFQIIKFAQIELFNLMSNSLEIHSNSKQHKHLKISKTKVCALGHFEC